MKSTTSKENQQVIERLANTGEDVAKAIIDFGSDMHCQGHFAGQRSTLFVVGFGCMAAWLGLKLIDRLLDK